MSTRTSIVTVVILTVLLLAGEVRADCLDGHLENFTISADVILTFGTPSYGVCPPPVEMTSNSGELSCPFRCVVNDEWTICPGPKVTYSVSTSPTGYTITATAEVDPREGQYTHGFLHEAQVIVSVGFERVGGLVDCTFQRVDKRVVEGVVTEMKRSDEWPLRCLASGNYVPGAVTCQATAICTPTVSSTPRNWINPNGGSYQVASNWTTDCVPAHDPPQRSDTAYFALASGAFIPVSGLGATAGQWVVINSPIEYSGGAQVFSTSDTNPSVRILQGGQLRLAGWAVLDSVHASVGASGATNSMLEVKGGSWTNSASARIGRGSVDVLDGGTASTSALSVGAGNGPGALHVTGDASTFDVTGALVVGDTTAGTLEIDKGLFKVTPLITVPVIGKSAPGTVTVRGDDSSLSSYGRLQTNRTLIVGDGASGRLNVQRGGHVSIDRDLIVGGYGANPAGEVIVDAQGGVNTLDVLGGTFVSATELQEIVVQNGGRVSTNELVIGDRQLRPGAADVTLRGASGSFPTLTVGIVGGGGAGTWVGDDVVPGQLNIQAGASAELNNGLYVGGLGQGIVMVSGLNAPPGPASLLKVAGETQVGISAPGIVQLDAEAFMENNGDMKIGLGSGNPSGSVNVNSGSFIRVHGTLSVGASGIGLLNILGSPNVPPSGVRCDTLLVGGDTLAATGIIVASFVSQSTPVPLFSHLTVDGNTQVGVSSGRGEILLADASGRLTINGTLTIGNASGGPGGGAVALVDATIDGTGNIVVNKNGSLIGTGTLFVPNPVSNGGLISIAPSGAPSPNGAAATKVTADGHIAALVSPRTLTIEGDYEQLPTGVLVIGYAGLNPGEFDVLHVTGQTTLGGRLEVHFRGGFSPDAPAEFIQSQSFVEADGGITGDYDERIYAFPDLFADFDDDGDKDLRDVGDFQNCFGLSGVELEPACERADWESDGVIGGREIQELGARLTGP